MMSHKILITICARGGSKGIPGKNIKTLKGKPLIYYSLKVAERFIKYERLTSSHIVLSTDSQEIKEVVNNLGIKVDTEYIRPDFLASDTAGKLDAIKDVKQYAEEKFNIKFDYLIDLDVTSPLRSVNDIQSAFEVLSLDTGAYNLFSVSKADRNPYFNMVEQGEDGYYTLCKKGSFLSRQTAPKVYDMNASFYIYKSKFFSEEFKTVITDKSLIYEVPHLCFDLDNSIDFDFMAYLLENDKLDFDFVK